MADEEAEKTSQQIEQQSEELCEEHIRDLVGMIRDMHVTAKAAEEALRLILAGGSVPNAIEQAKKLPLIGPKTTDYYNALLREFEQEAKNSGVNRAAEVLRKKLRQ